MIRTKMEGNWSGLDEALVLKFSTFVAPRSTVDLSQLTVEPEG